MHGLTLALTIDRRDKVFYVHRAIVSINTSTSRLLQNLLNDS